MDQGQERDHLAERRAQDTKWVAIQHKTFTRWCNTFLKERMQKIDSLETDLKDGVQLITLLEIISSKQIHGGRYNKKPRIRVQMMENNQFALEFLAQEGIKVVNVGNNDIVDCNLKIILGLIWTIILRYQINLSEGGSARSELLKWVRSKIPTYNITNFSPDWNDGKALCALVDALQPGLCPNHADLDASKALENATLGEDLGEEHFGIPKVLDPSDMISEDLDELSMMTYISYYRDWEGNHAAKEAEERMLRTAIPSACKAYGPGLEPGVLANVPTDFTIEAINAKGTRVPCGGDPFVVKITAPSGEVTEPTPADHDDGTYGVEYTATEVGPYKIQVSLNDEDISGSVFDVDVARNAPDAGNCKAYGPGLEPGCKVGEPAPFVIEAVGPTGVRCSEGGDDFQVKVAGPGDHDVKVDVKDNGDGTYAVAYHPIKAGDHEVSVKLNGADDIQGSVFKVAIDANEGDADAANTIAYGPGVEGPVDTAEPAVFTVETRNAAGDKVTLSNDDAPIDCWVEDPDKNEVDADVVDNGDGTRTVTYQPTAVGPHVVNVVLRNRYEPTIFEHIKDSPFTVDVAQGTFGANCEAFGPGLESGVPKATIETEFTIQGKDRDGENCTAGGAVFDVEIAGPGGAAVPSDQTDNGDGTYTVKYTAADPGDHVVKVSLKDTPIKDSPFDVTIKSATDAAMCEASGPGLGDRVHDGQPTEFTIQAKDREGDNIKEGGDPFVAKIEGPNGDVPVDITDNGDGTYTAKYTPTDKGPHTVNVTLEDTPIKDMPKEVDVKSKVDPGHCEAHGPGVEGPLEDTDDGVFTIQAKDFDGNNVEEGGEEFVVTVKGPAGDIDADVSDNGDGTYDVMYAPDEDGTYTIDIKLHDESIKDAPFTLDVGEGVSAANTKVEAFTFVVQAFSKKGGPKTKGGAKFEVKINDKATGEALDEEVSKLSVKDRGTGKYRIMYCLPEGEYEISCLVGGRHISGSPMTQSGVV